MRRVLIIEDDPDQGALLMRRLREEGFACSLSTTLAEGLSFCREQEFDCIVLDLGLPDPELQSEADTIARIPDLGWPVVVLTGSGDPNIISAVRRTGASIVVKPNTDLLVEKIWSQINFQRAGHDSEVGQQTAQRRLNHKPFLEKTGAVLSLAIAIFTGTATLGGWLYKTISDEARQAEITKHRFEVIDRRLDTADAIFADRAQRLKALEQMAQVSTDDRSAIRGTMAALQDTQRELKLDVIRRLERIEDKLDRQKEKAP